MASYSNIVVFSYVSVLVASPGPIVLKYLDKVKDSHVPVTCRNDLDLLLQVWRCTVCERGRRQGDLFWFQRFVSWCGRVGMGLVCVRGGVVGVRGMCENLCSLLLQMAGPVKG